MNNKAYSITELLISSVLIVLLFGCAMGTYILSKRIYVDCIVSANLQRDIAVVARRLTQGVYDGGSMYGLTGARSYHLQSPVEIHFVGTDGNERKISLIGNQIVYHGQSGDTTLYTAPASSTISLLFTNPGIAAGSPILGTETVSFYIGVLEDMMGRKASASLQTYVNVRNL